MINQVNSYWWLKLNGLLRYTLVHSSTRLLPLYVVNEYPKSGGSWLGEMLSEALGVPFPRNRLPLFSSSIMHGHMMHSWNMHNVIVMWRDGRDVAVSHYFHSLFKNDKGNTLLVDKTRSALGFQDYSNIKKNLPAFLEYTFDTSKNNITWPNFVDYWHSKPGVVDTSYEALREDSANELSKIIAKLGVKQLSPKQYSEISEKFSFKNMSGRAAGEVNKSSFLRKGIVGDWKNHFDAASCEIFEHYGGQALINLGYEKDSSWANNNAIKDQVR